MYDPLIVSVMDDCARELADEGVEIWLDGKYRMGQQNAQERTVLDVLSCAVSNRWDGSND